MLSSFRKGKFLEIAKKEMLLTFVSYRLYRDWFTFTFHSEVSIKGKTEFYLFSLLPCYKLELKISSELLRLFESEFVWTVESFTD